MAIKNKWLAQQQLKKAVEIRAAEAQARNFTIQQCKDMMLLAAHEAFGFGEERLKQPAELCTGQHLRDIAEAFRLAQFKQVYP